MDQILKKLHQRWVLRKTVPQREQEKWQEYRCKGRGGFEEALLKQSREAWRCGDSERAFDQMGINNDFLRDQFQWN
jgi:hypothetical protein